MVLCGAKRTSGQNGDQKRLAHSMSASDSRQEGARDKERLCLYRYRILQFSMIGLAPALPENVKDKALEHICHHAERPLVSEGAGREMTCSVIYHLYYKIAI